MIPLKLYMRNFMCYREQTLDLRGVHLACLTGNNGHGKSAILDAMTWTLWGRSRVGARRDDELIRLGQTEMEAEFEFVLLEGMAAGEERASSGTRYRVIRKRTRRRRGQSSLELQGWDAVTDRFRPLNESTMARTQHKINELLRMDYDTFINSAFLLQGRADEFTIKRPAERKRVLGDILGLQIYDRYETLAKQVAQERKERGDQLLATVEQIDQELAREPEYRTAVHSAEAELARLQEERATMEERYDRVRAELQKAESVRQQLADLERRIAATKTEMDRLAQEISSHHDHMQVLQGALAEEAKIEDGFQAYQQAAADSEAMNVKLAESASLKEQRSTLEQRIAAARHELDVERHSAVEQVHQLERLAAMLDQQPEWEKLQADLALLDKRASEKEATQSEIQDLSAEMAAMQADNKRAEKDAQQIKEKIALLSSTGKESSVVERARQDKTAHCPLCGQPLAESNCAQLLEAFEDQLQAERDAYGERNAQIQENRQRVGELKARISDLDRELHQRTGWQRKEAALAHVIAKGREAQASLPAARERQQAIEAELESQGYAPEARARLVAVEQQLGKLGYDADAHRLLQNKLQGLRIFEEQMQTLREARSSIETVRLAISQLEQNREKVEGRLTEDRARAAELVQVVQDIPSLQRQALEARRVLETAHDREQQANLRLGAARNKVDYCADLTQQRVQRLREERSLRTEQSIYQELQRAFGKNGVQAMLIESAIPDIEQEANQLLARMTRGRMHVRFETQRDTKKGNTIETLDIHITDELGTRSYETYSGGERYRINFAIRIALSKLLARRAGAQLQMLVIDEGFGTQDDEGRDGLIDAINAIQDDFACILVITHIEELKDVFDVRIQVVKTADGSEIAVV